MEKIELEVKERAERGRELKKVRSQGMIPAVVYGKKIKPLAIAIDYKMFVNSILRSEAGMNAIVSLKLSGKQTIPVLTQEVQRNPVNDAILHIDFRHLVMDEAIKTKVPIELAGVALGVKDSGGVLVHGLREVEVECLPTDIPDKFEVDVSSLLIGDSFHISDLKLPARVKILTNPTEMIANCSPPTKEEVAAAPLPTPEEAAATAQAVATEEIKEKSAPGAPPPAPKTEKK
jgi:large subunit ribosomal protein L25